MRNSAFYMLVYFRPLVTGLLQAMTWICAMGAGLSLLFSISVPGLLVSALLFLGFSIAFFMARWFYDSAVLRLTPPDERIGLWV